jgi:hypothetical protein
MLSFDRAYEYGINGRPDDWRSLFDDDSSYRDNGGARAAQSGEKTAWDLFFEEQANGDPDLTVTIPAEDDVIGQQAEPLETIEGTDNSPREAAAREISTLALSETIEIAETAA